MVAMTQSADHEVRGPPNVFLVPADQHQPFKRTYGAWWHGAWKDFEEPSKDVEEVNRLSSSAARRLRRKRAAVERRQPQEAASPGAKELRSLLKQSPDEAARRVRGHVYVLARDPVACRILQEVIERSSSREAVEVVNELQGHVWELAMCPHGNYVVQKVVSHLSVSSSHFVVKELEGYAARAAKHRFACRILCRLLEFCGSPAATLVDELLEETSQLCCHSFAHHVIQSVLEHGEGRHKQQIAAALLADCFRFATHKHSSYLIEKALCYCNDHDQQALVLALGTPKMLLELARTAYGSFVARAFLEDERVNRGATLALFRRHQVELEQTKHGHRLLVEVGLIEAD